MIEQAVDPYDVMAGRAVRCELVMDEHGANVTVNRADGCTPADVVDMCRLVAAGDPLVRDA